MGAVRVRVGPVEDADHDTAARVAIRALADAYAHHVDARDCEAVAALFGAEGRLIAHFHRGPDGAPVVRQGRAAIVAALVEGLARYERTTHVVGGQVLDIDAGGRRARGETVCLAHHLYMRRGERRLLVMAVRYEDDYACEAGVWRFSSRQLRLDWRDDRPLPVDGAPADGT